jgi:Plasmid encoded RepA protein
MPKNLSPETINELITRSLAIEAEEAQDAGALGFMARAMTLASLPHSRVDGNEFERRNGAFSLSIVAPSRVGLPYGTVPRLLLAWLTTEAVRTKSRELVLGDSLSAFMRQLDLVPTGGRWGSINRLKDQTTRLFASSITAIYQDSDKTAMLGYRVADKALLWWDAKDPRQGSLWQSAVTLTEPFFTEIVERPVPVDMRALKALKRSPMALDLYCWLTYRASYLKKPTEVSWAGLQGQFGADYPRTGQGLRDFRKAFTHHLTKVTTVYRDARATPTPSGVRLEPARPHVRRLVDGR